MGNIYCGSPRELMKFSALDIFQLAILQFKFLLFMLASMLLIKVYCDPQFPQ